MCFRNFLWSLYGVSWQ